MLLPVLLAAFPAPQTALVDLPRLDALEGFGSESFESFRFVQIGDPQIGYGSTWPAARRLEQLAREIAALDAAFGIVVGDLVQDRTWLEKRLLRSALPEFSLPLAFVPGNHDVVDAATLADYRSEFGRDYYSFVYKGCGFLGLDSELFEANMPPAELEAQREWLATELGALRARNLRHLFLFLHRPPFLHAAAENRDDPLVRALRENGIRHVLAGHLHATLEIEPADGAYTVFTVGGTSKITDERGYGYRVFEVGEQGVEQRYVEFDRPSDHWFVRYGWSPRLLDPSPTHWALTLVFLFTARLCWRARKRAPVLDPEYDESAPGASARAAWGLLTAGYLVLAFNLQLDFDEMLAAVGRKLVYGLGIAAQRRYWQALVLAGALVLGLIALLVGRRYLRRAGQRALLALLGFSLPLASFLLHTLSLHQTEALLYALGRNGLYLVEAAGAALSCWSAILALRT